MHIKCIYYHSTIKCFPLKYNMRKRTVLMQKGVKPLIICCDVRKGSSPTSDFCGHRQKCNYWLFFVDPFLKVLTANKFFLRIFIQFLYIFIQFLSLENGRYTFKKGRGQRGRLCIIFISNRLCSLSCYIRRPLLFFNLHFRPSPRPRNWKWRCETDERTQDIFAATKLCLFNYFLKNPDDRVV